MEVDSRKLLEDFYTTIRQWIFRLLTAGEVRFRLTSGDNPKSFKMGSDLHVRNTALPWRTTLLTMTERKIYKPIRELLLADGLVAPALLTKCGEIAKETNRRFRA
jgi:hypothetical protein